MPRTTSSVSVNNENLTAEQLAALTGPIPAPAPGTAVVERPKSVAEMMAKARSRDWNENTTVTHRFGKTNVAGLYGTMLKNANANAVSEVSQAYREANEERFASKMDELSEHGSFRVGEFLPGESKPTFTKRPND